MVNTNVKIIEELKCFLEVVSKNPQIRKHVTQSESDFTRDRKLPFEYLVGIIINMPKRSLNVEIAEFFESLVNSVKPCTKGAFSLQRVKLQPLFFQAWANCLVNSFYYYYADKVKLWRGFRVQAVDGSTAYLLNKPDVIEHFGTQDNQHGGKALARVMQIHDILNNITVWGDICPCKESEQTIIARQVSDLHKDSLVLFDRGYPSFSLMYLMLNQETPRHFVMRCQSGFNNVVKQFVKSNSRSRIVELVATKDAIATLYQHGFAISAKTTVKVRMVKVRLSSGQEEILLTSLYDERLYTLEDLKYLYGLRWRIETAYSKQKNQMQMEQFSGHRVICIEQDYFAGLFVANLQSLLEKQCDDHIRELNKTRKYNCQINQNLSWASLKHNIVRLFMNEEPQEILLQLQIAFERNVEPIRPGRHYPRSKARTKGKGKFQTFSNFKRAI